MQQIKEHIIFKCITLLLVAALFVPAVRKITHIFEDHKHDICQGEKATHLHEIDTDCDFYKFNTTTPFYNITSEYIGFVKTPLHLEPTIIPYHYLKSYWQLSFSLRGPPLVV